MHPTRENPSLHVSCSEKKIPGARPPGGPKKKNVQHKKRRLHSTQDYKILVEGRRAEARYILVSTHKGCQGASTEVVFSVSFWILANYIAGARFSTGRHGRNWYVFVLFLFTPGHIMVPAHKDCQGAKTDIAFSVSFWIDTNRITGTRFNTSRHDRACFVFVLFSFFSDLILALAHKGC